jgi:hypothetical protein
LGFAMKGASCDYDARQPPSGPVLLESGPERTPP